MLFECKHFEDGKCAKGIGHGSCASATINDCPDKFAFLICNTNCPECKDCTWSRFLNIQVGKPLQKCSVLDHYPYACKKNWFASCVKRRERLNPYRVKVCRFLYNTFERGSAQYISYTVLGLTPMCAAGCYFLRDASLNAPLISLRVITVLASIFTFAWLVYRFIFAIMKKHDSVLTDAIRKGF